MDNYTDKEVYSYRISSFSKGLLEYLSEELGLYKNGVIDASILSYYNKLVESNLIEKKDSPYTSVTEDTGEDSLSYIHKVYDEIRREYE